MSEKVTYTEIIEALARKSGQSKQKSEAFTKGLISEIKSELKENGKASITNFGSFKVKEVAEREGQNPQTGEPITIPAHKRVSFSPYKALRETVNKKYAHLETKLVQEQKATSKQNPQSGASKKADQKTDKKGMSTMTLVLGILIPAIVVVLIALFLLFDPLGSDSTTTTSTTTPATSEMPVQEESSQTEATSETSEAETETATSNSQEEQSTNEAAENEVSEVENDPVSVESTNAEVSYQVNQNEWYWVIAENVYGNAQFWPLLFQQNQTVDDDPDQVSPSLGLVVPELEGSSQNLSIGDYQNLASAARMVSEAYENSNKPGKAEDYARLAAKWERESK